MSEIHTYRSGLADNSHLSLVGEILEIASRRVPNNESEIWFANLTCLWTNVNHPEVLQINRGLPYGTRTTTSSPYHVRRSIRLDLSAVATVDTP
jgi:hypothetical protein